MITELDIRRAVTRLAAVYPRRGTEDSTVNAWRYVFEGEDYLESHHLREAVRITLKAGGRFAPSPGEILQEAKRIYRADASKTHDVAAGSASAPCPVCGATLRLLTPQEQSYGGFYSGDNMPRAPRFGVFHDREKHERAGIGCAGYW